MAYPALRSMNAELDTGSTEGTYKKVVNNRGGVVEGLTARTRLSLNDTYFGMHEDVLQLRPDGQRAREPYFVSTPPAEHLGLVG